MGAAGEVAKAVEALDGQGQGGQQPAEQRAVGLMVADEMGQPIDHRRSLVARRHSTAARLLQALKELSRAFGANVIEAELITRFMDFARDEGDE